MLLIGGDSYIGRSISKDIKSTGGIVTSYSSKVIFSDFAYEQFDPKIITRHDFAVIIATPGHLRAENGLKINANIFKYLSESDLKVYALSTIHTLQGNNLSEYVTLNREFEKIALTYNFKVLRVPNFIGFVPTRSDSQSQLLPWSLLLNFQKNGRLEINSNLDSKFEWITSADLVDCILKLQKYLSPSIVEVQPGFECELRDLVKYFTDFASITRDIYVQIQVNNSEIRRKIFPGPNPIGLLGWKTELSDKLLQNYFYEYLGKNWGEYA